MTNDIDEKLRRRKANRKASSSVSALAVLETEYYVPVEKLREILRRYHINVRMEFETLRARIAVICGNYHLTKMLQGPAMSRQIREVNELIESIKKVQSNLVQLPIDAAKHAMATSVLETKKQLHEHFEPGLSLAMFVLQRTAFKLNTLPSEIGRGSELQRNKMLKAIAALLDDGKVARVELWAAVLEIVRVLKVPLPKKLDATSVQRSQRRGRTKKLP